MNPPGPTTVAALVAHAALAFGEKELLRFEDESITVAAFADEVGRIAEWLHDVGLGDGDRVAIMLPNTAEFPLCWMGILVAGAVAVPVNTSLKSADLTHIVEDSDCKLIITTAELAATVSAATSRVPLSIASLLRLEAQESPSLLEERAAAAKPDDLANLQYTSGTTGLPKACMLGQEFMLGIGRAAVDCLRLESDDVLMTTQPFSYIDPQWNLLAALTVGCTLVVRPKFSASGFWPAVREHGVTVFYVLASMPTLLLKQPPGPDDLKNSVRLVYCSAIPRARHAELEERWGAPWREVYGLTESGFDLATSLEEVDTVGTGIVGRPVPGKDAKIVDETGAVLGTGDVGELLIGGAPLMRGYWNRPEDTARALTDGWLRTGDLAELDESGRYRIVGRLKDMVRRGGENISSAEVERALEQHPAVQIAAVTAHPDELWGEVPKAFIELVPDAPRTQELAAELHAFSAERMAKFKVPRYVEFVDALPRTASERVAKHMITSSGAHFDLTNG